MKYRAFVTDGHHCSVELGQVVADNYRDALAKAVTLTKDGPTRTLFDEFASDVMDLHCCYFEHEEGEYVFEVSVQNVDPLQEEPEPGPIGESEYMVSVPDRFWLLARDGPPPPFSAVATNGGL